MIRHVSQLTWLPGASDDAGAAVFEALAALPGAVPEIRGYRFGPDLALDPDNADFAIVADFDSMEGYHAYQDHPAHRAVLTERIRPILATRAAAQYELFAPGEPPPHRAA